MPPMFTRITHKGDILAMASRSKYNNCKTVVNGISFDSKREAERYMELQYLLNERKIQALKCHPVYLLQEAFDRDGKRHRKIEYEADFEYIDQATGKTIVEDVKGWKTEIYKIKKKLFLKNLPENTVFMEIK